MATRTPNYNLKKPDPSDFVNVADLNENADRVDGALMGKADKVLATSAAGNLAVFDEGGNLADSGKKPDGFVASGEAPGVWYGTCSSAIAATTKTVVLTEQSPPQKPYSHKNGNIVVVTFTNGSAVSEPFLSVAGANGCRVRPLSGGKSFFAGAGERVPFVLQLVQEISESRWVPLNETPPAFAALCETASDTPGKTASPTGPANIVLVNFANESRGTYTPNLSIGYPNGPLVDEDGRGYVNHPPGVKPCLWESSSGTTGTWRALGTPRRVFSNFNTWTTGYAGMSVSGVVAERAGGVVTLSGTAAFTALPLLAGVKSQATTSNFPAWAKPREGHGNACAFLAPYEGAVAKAGNFVTVMADTAASNPDQFALSFMPLADGPMDVGGRYRFVLTYLGAEAW
jgi:hypothetical protein